MGKTGRVDGSLDARLAVSRTATDGLALNALGNDLFAVGRYTDAADCFRRAVACGETWASFNLGNALSAAGSLLEAVTAYEIALADGEIDAWLNLGMVLEDLGDLAGALRAYQAGSAADDANATVALAFMLREQGQQLEAERVMTRAVEQGSKYGAAVLATWRWGRTRDATLEEELRQGADLYPSARASLGQLLRATGRLQEAIAVLQHGLDADECESAIPLGNIYADDLFDTASAADAYRRGIDLGDAFSHHNLAGLLEHEGNLEEAINHYRMAAAEGDELAARALRRISDSDD